jgi:ATP-dependent Clp protease adaptor protein ClpS
VENGIDLMPAIILPEETQAEPSLEPAAGRPPADSPYIVVVYNDEVHTFDEVEQQLQKATGCTLEKAEALAVEIDSKGRAVVYSGSSLECERVANVLREIRLQVEVDRA